MAVDFLEVAVITLPIKNLIPLVALVIADVLAGSISPVLD